MPDATSFAKLGYTLKDATKMVEGFSTASISSIFKMEAAFVGAFGAIGLGLVALADRTAMADQSYRLLGLRMLMTKQSARAMQMSLDALGATLDEVAYDPELNKRFQDMYEQVIQMQEKLGPTFDKNMKSIRLLKDQYKIFGMEVELAVAGAVSKAFQSLGYSEDEVLQKFKDFNREIQDNLPWISEQISSVFVPAWNDAKTVLSDTGDIVKMLTQRFMTLVGIMDDDESIQNADVNFKNLAKTLTDLLDIITKTILSLDLMAKIAIHAGSAVWDTLMASHYASPFGGFQFGKAKEWASKAADESVSMAADVRDLVTPGGEANWTKNPDYAGIVAYNRSHGFDPVTGAKNLNMTPLDDSYMNIFLGGAGRALTGTPVPGAGVLGTDIIGHNLFTKMKGLAAVASAATGIPAHIILAQWAHETKGFTSDVFKRDLNLAGVGHRKEGGHDVYTHYNTLEEAEHGWVNFIKQKKYASTGVLGARTIPEFAKDIKAGGWYEDTPENYIRNMQKWDKTFQGGNVYIQNQTIVIPPETPYDVGKEMVAEAIKEAFVVRNQRDTAQVAGGPYH